MNKLLKQWATAINAQKPSQLQGSAMRPPDDDHLTTDRIHSATVAGIKVVSAALRPILKVVGSDRLINSLRNPTILTDDQDFLPNLHVFERLIAMVQKRDDQSSGWSLAQADSLESAGMTLARWLPPFRARAATPKADKPPPGKPAKRALPRGWRITRSMFSEFSED